MRKPLPSIVTVATLFLVLGGLDLYLGLAPFLRAGASAMPPADDLEIAAVGVTAAVGGAFLISGHNWARWLLAVWMAFHVALSVHEPLALLLHVVIFGLILFLLFRPRAAAHFRGHVAT